MGIKLLNTLKQTITEQNNVGELEFGKMWYSPEYGNAIYFGDFNKSLSDIDQFDTIKLIDKNTNDVYFLDPEIYKISGKGTSIFLPINEFARLYPQKAENFLKKEEKINDNSWMNVNNLKTKKSGVPQTILDALKMVYPNNWGRINDVNCETLDGVIDIFPAIPGERWSILNFFDTNPGVLKILSEKYLLEEENTDLEGFKQWILDKKDELFGEYSLLLQELVKRNMQSFQRGWETESQAINAMKKTYSQLKDDDFIQYCLGSIKDRVSGVDFTVKGKGFQTKPASKMERVPGGIKVYTYGMRDWYKNKKDVDFIIYVKDDKIAIFPNYNYNVSYDGKSVIHYTDLVKNPFN